MALSNFFGRRLPPTPLTPSTPTTLPILQESITPILPMTPPDPNDTMTSHHDAETISTALHVLSTERAALEYIQNLYENDRSARKSLVSAVNQIVKTIHNHGKLVVCGVGKSGKIGEKVVATMNSLGIQSSFLHPTEALHGDLGMIRPNDIILFITFSGRTSELLCLLPHISPDTTVIALTAHTSISTCPLFTHRPHGMGTNILLPATAHETEKASFGLAAPTTSTTVALAVADALAMATAKRLHSTPDLGPPEIFAQNHPGGAIGAAVAGEKPRLMSDIVTLVDTVPIALPQGGPSHPFRVLDIVLAAVRSPGGWVRTDALRIVAPRRIQKFVDMNTPVQDLMILEDSPIVEKSSWISILGSSTVEEAREWMEKMLGEPRGKTFLKKGTLLGIVDAGGIVSGVVEIEEVVGEGFERAGEFGGRWGDGDG